MEFSEDWKSEFPVSFVPFLPPLVTDSSENSEKPLGPLLFNPLPQTLTTLFSSDSLRIQVPSPSLPTCNSSFYQSLSTLSCPSKDPFIPPSVIASVGADELKASQSDKTTDPIGYNNLQVLRCPDGEILVFFPTGDNSDRVGFVKLSLEGKKPELKVDRSGNIFTSESVFNSRILKIMVTSIAAAGNGFPSLSGHYVTVGYLLACTLYSVHWFRVDIGPSEFEKPLLVHLGIKEFRSSVLHACWSPHFIEESVVLLENGDMLLFDLRTCFGVDKMPVKLKGTRVKASWENSDFDLHPNASNPVKGKWLSCEFGWHPRIFVIASAAAVFEVDWRSEESTVSAIAEPDSFAYSHFTKPDQFVAFGKAGSDGFHFCVASKFQLYLIDTRKPMTPVLGWVHGIDKPNYIEVFRLSELRPLTANKDEFRWATESGFAILLGSLWNCDYSLFCYGPAPYASVASQNSNICNSLCAWERPSDLSVSGRQCRSGDCHLKEDFAKAMLPRWIDWRQKKEIVLGFCILGAEFSDFELQRGGVGGFRLIRLVSSGKFELQIYGASHRFSNTVAKESTEQTLSEAGSLIYSFNDQKYKFPRRFKYLRLNYLLSYLNGNLATLLNSNMQDLSEGSRYTVSSTQDRVKFLCDRLKAAGVDQIGSVPDIANVINGIHSPMSVHEIALSRIWAGLPIDVFPLAFSAYPELLEVLVDQKKVPLEFLDVPNSPQLPPFLLRKPSNQSNKWSHKVQPVDVLVGPVLPLAVLLNLQGVDKKTIRSASEEEVKDFPIERELTLQCDTIMRVANGGVLSEPLSEHHNVHAVSLADDRDESWVASKEVKSLFVYQPSAFPSGNNHRIGSLRENSGPQDDEFATFISKSFVNESAPKTKGSVESLGRSSQNESAPKTKQNVVGLEMIDDLCPIKLKFNSPLDGFGTEELKGINFLKRHFSAWQRDIPKYQEFCRASKIQRQAL